jgi:hypothetical protein
MISAIVLINTERSKVNTVADALGHIEDITKTETLIAFQAYSKHDLERMFSIGT